jgi:hypothetical protein
VCEDERPRARPHIVYAGPPSIAGELGLRFGKPRPGPPKVVGVIGTLAVPSDHNRPPVLVDGCPELATILDGWDGQLTILMRKRIARHIEGCPTCDDERRRLVNPVALLGAVPVFIPAPHWLRDHTLSQVQLSAATVPTGGAGTADAGPGSGQAGPDTTAAHPHQGESLRGPGDRDNLGAAHGGGARELMRPAALVVGALVTSAGLTFGWLHHQHTPMTTTDLTTSTPTPTTPGPTATATTTTNNPPPSPPATATGVTPRTTAAPSPPAPGPTTAPGAVPVTTPATPARSVPVTPRVPVVVPSTKPSLATPAPPPPPPPSPSPSPQLTIKPKPGCVGVDPFCGPPDDGNSSGQPTPR